MKNRKHKIAPVAVIVALLSCSVLAMAFTYKNSATAASDYTVVPDKKKDSIASVKAFAKVYSVLMSPRCMNCHPKGDVPLQGEDSHLHQMNPQRGKDGKGLYAMKCANCHQPENTPGLHMPPGNPNWHLPPADMKMVFQGKTPHELAKQLVNPKLNGNKNIKQLIEHADDGLVLSGWNPGQGLKKPPMTHAEFKKAWIEWIEKGAYAPAP